MANERMQLAPLDPMTDRVHYERLVHAILDAAAPELARRAENAGLLALVGAWSRPVLAAAAMIALAIAGALFSNRELIQRPGATNGMVQALGVAEPVAIWLDEERSPSMNDLMRQVEGDAP